MTTKHTPGPWHVDTEDQDADIHSGFGMVAKTMGHGHAQDGEGTANARLIAAAPELLDALQSMVSQFPEAELRADPDLHASVKRARAAIAKAVMQ